jgi:Peptidase C13 family
MKRILLALCLMLCAGPASAAGFGNWAVLIVAGDDHAHSGAPSDVFDNARRDLAKAFVSIGFSPANIVQFSTEPVLDAQHTETGAIANALWDLSSRAPGGCLIYFTSHGVYDRGIVVDNELLAPDKMAAMVNNACGNKPSMIVMSACFSGQFVPALAGPNRIIFTAARPDRTSFGCGESDHYTFFDTCFLQSLPASGDFPGLAEMTTACVAKREHDLGASPPSEPQLAIGNNVMYTLRWK